MAPPELQQLILGPINRTGIQYMVTGGVAAIAYGEPRLTNDVDIVVDASARDANKFTTAFPVAEYYVRPAEALRVELGRSRHGHFTVIHHDTGLRADTYVAGDDALNAWGLERRHTESIGDDAIWFAPIEYVIIRKLEYFTQGGSDRHLRDIGAMLRISGALVDRPSLDRFIADHGLEDAWGKAEAHIDR